MHSKLRASNRSLLLKYFLKSYRSLFVSIVMRLCIVTHSFAKGSGQGLVNYEVVQAAIRRGWSLTLVSSHLETALQAHPRVTWQEIKVAKLPTELARNMAFSMQATQWINQHRAEFDVLQVNGAIVAADANVNVAHFVHSAWLRSPAHTVKIRKDLYGLYQGLYTAVNAHWEKRAFQRANNVIAVSQKIAEELEDIGVDPSRIEVIINGVDLAHFSPGVADRQTLGLPKNVPLALFAGDIQTSRKNLDTILAALVAVPDLHIAIAGRTQGSPYPAMAESLNVDDRVHFLDYRRDIASLMKAADFFVFPSRYEACTLVLIEAMASGLPVVTAVTAGGSELVTPECGIVLSDPNDVHSLSSALGALTKDDKKRQAMGENARRTAEKHSWGTMADQYLQLFESAAKPVATAT